MPIDRHDAGGADHVIAAHSDSMITCFDHHHGGDIEMQFLLAVNSMAGKGLKKAMKIRALKYLLSKEMGE
jgi:hypothetical protein